MACWTSWPPGCGLQRSESPDSVPSEFELIARHPEIPYRVVINEAVELAKTFGGTDGYKYVNGVLDRVAGRLRPAEAQPRR